MKIVRFLKDGQIRYGLLDGERIDVLAGEPFEAIRPDGTTAALGEVKLLAPVSPPNVLAIGLNYRQHALETKAAIPDRPLLFIKASTSVIAAGDPIVLPAMAPDEVDYEAELAVVIGRAARDVAPDDALSYVLGYTCGNDVSARDCQKRLDRQWARAKSFDTFCPLGPWIETDLDPTNAPVRCRVNGRTMQDSSTSDMIFPCAQLISYLSHCLTLLPGTVILTGTPPGVGVAREPAVYLRAGDVVEVEIGGVGVLRNPVAAARA
ncbi:MAG: fumarylacetoacetate hydrolase family protein [Planctomycetota bacterium]|nr:fumarylacetoacetate hydrolase family protein [Planctomycetota bacterium]